MAYISPGFASDSVQHRSERATYDFTRTVSYEASGKQPFNTPTRDTQKGIPDHKELFISRELNKLRKIRHINLGNHLTKKLANLLKSRQGFLASFKKELKDANYKSPKVRAIHLQGLPKPIHGRTVNSNEPGPEMDDQVLIGLAEFTYGGTMSHNPSESDNLATERHEPHHKVSEKYYMSIDTLILSWTLMNLDINKG